jgi:hypothetical protein
LNNFKRSNITDEEKLQFIEKLTSLKKCIVEKGEITDEDFDRLQFRETRVRDGKRVNQRRTVILTKPELTKQATTGKVSIIRPTSGNKANSTNKKAWKTSETRQRKKQKTKTPVGSLLSCNYIFYLIYSLQYIILHIFYTLLA